MVLSAEFKLILICNFHLRCKSDLLNALNVTAIIEVLY